MKTGHLAHDFSSVVIASKPGPFPNILINLYFMNIGDYSVYFACFSRSFLADSLNGFEPFRVT